MKVIKAKTLGFCMGVRRAVDIAMAQVKQGSPCYTLGPLIHNPKVLLDLKTLGIEAVNESSALKQGSAVIIRAHGISPLEEENLNKRGCSIIDATCPKVKKSQLQTRDLSSEGYCIFLAGEKDHAEMEGIRGYAKDAPFCAVVSGEKEAIEYAAKLLKENQSAKTALLGQTTISQDEYKIIGESIKKYFPALKIINTICAATNERQKALRRLLNKTDAVIIAGGRQSANTRRLLAIAKDSEKPCVLAEDISQIPDYFYSYRTVGIAAGASTPDSVIENIEKELLTKGREI